MSAAKHTPGPWTAGTSGFTIGGISFLPVQVGNLGSAKVSEADLTLIAAAPKLLAAAKLAALNFKRSNDSDNFLGDDDHEAWTALDAAIAEAEGQQP